MKQRLSLKYTNPTLHIGMNSWKKVYMLGPNTVPLLPEVYRGNLMYRAKGSSGRIPYSIIKIGLRKLESFVEQEVPYWL